ncbi:MAG: hypothetical protein ACI4SP_04685 [Eubacteriales bacterium]
MEKKLTHENMKDIVTAAIVFVIGVLFCCSLAMGMRGLSWLVGLSLMVAGTLYFVNSILRKKALATMEGIIGAAIFAFGFFFIANELANLVVAYIPWLLICVGAVIFIDAFLRKFLRKDKSTSGFVAQLIIGAASLALGICLRFVPGFGDFTALMLGILLIVYAVFLVVNVFLGRTPETKKSHETATIETTAEPVTDTADKPVAKPASTKSSSAKSSSTKSGSAKTGSAKSSDKPAAESAPAETPVPADSATEKTVPAEDSAASDDK